MLKKIAKTLGLLCLLIWDLLLMVLSLLWKVFKWCFSVLGSAYQSEKTDKNAGKKYRFARVCVCILMAFLIVYFAYIIFLQGPGYKEAAYAQQNRTFTQQATRGNIYDANGKLLAATIESRTICVSKETITEYGSEKYKDGDLEDYQRLVATKLAGFLDMDEEWVLERIKGEGNYWNIATDVDPEIGDKIKAWVDSEKIKGVTVESDTSRYYPYGSLASHLIGFTGTDDHGLVCGLEVGLDKELSGTDGKIIATVEKNGNAITGYPTTVLTEKVDGVNAQLTIDINIQKIADELLATAVKDFGAIEGGCVVVMNAKNTDVLAMASNPTFDLNNPRNAEELLGGRYFWREGAEFDEKFNAGELPEESEKPDILSSFLWKNKAISTTYEPGSTFKAITASIALEEGVVTPSTYVNDDDLNLAGWTIHCSTSEKPGGHGNELFRYGVANSCNPVMARVALMVGVDTFYDYVKAFGFRNKTNILLSGETVGVIHTSPSEIDLAVTAFGQRFTLTPIQLATAYCAIANGGTLNEPRLVKSFTDGNGNVVEEFPTKEVRQVISEETSKTVMNLLEGVVNEGTGGNAYIAGYRIAGKTGTAETLTTETDGRYIVSFCAVAPSDDPEIVVLVMLDHPTIGEQSGAKMGTRLAAQVVKKTLTYMGVPRVYDEDDIAKIKNVYFMNKVDGMTVTDAIVDLKNKSGRHHNVIVLGNGDKVLRQFPEGGTYVAREGTVILFTEEDESLQPDYVKVPDVMGMGLGEAHAAITDIGLNLYAVTTGKVVSQDIEPGTQVPKGTVVSLVLKENTN